MTKLHKAILLVAFLVLAFIALSQPRYVTKPPVQPPVVERMEQTAEPVLDARPKTFRLGRIIDGDTFIAVDAKNNETKVRMAGIDAPETKQVYGKEATEYLTSLLHDTFTLKQWDVDRYDRQIVTVLVDGTDINQLMVANGYAWAYDSKNGPSYAEDQAEAREERRGLWNEKSTLPPWYFRKISGHNDYGYQLLKGGFYLWDGVIHNHNCPDKVDAVHSWNGIDPYENCPKCGGLVYD